MIDEDDGLVFDINSSDTDISSSERTQWEFFLKLRFFTSDLHISNIEKLTEENDERRFDEQCKKDFANDFAFIIVGLKHISPITTFKRDVTGRIMKQKMVINSINLTKSGNRKFLLPLNYAIDCRANKQYNSSVQTIYIFKVCLGRSMLVLDEERLDHMPAHYDSILWATNVNIQNPEIPDVSPFLSKHPELVTSWQKNSKINNNLIWVNLKFPKQQILPMFICNINFQALRIQSSLPICDNCEFAPAKYYCSADHSHFCEGCDAVHHSISKILASHKRVSVSQSPHIFGTCEDHTTCLINAVCETCFKPLCPNCQIMGEHSKFSSSRQHATISTFDAYSKAINGIGDLVKGLEDSQINIIKIINDLQTYIGRTLKNFKEVSDKLIKLEKECFDRIDREFIEPRQTFLLSLKRQYILELLFIDTIEKFWDHVKNTLPPGNYIEMYEKIKRLVQQWFIRDISHFGSNFKKDQTTNYEVSAAVYQLPTETTLEELQMVQVSFNGNNFKTSNDIHISGQIDIVTSGQEQNENINQPANANSKGSDDSNSGDTGNKTDNDNDQFFDLVNKFSANYYDVTPEALNELIELDALHIDKEPEETSVFAIRKTDERDIDQVIHKCDFTEFNRIEKNKLNIESLTHKANLIWKILSSNSFSILSAWLNRTVNCKTNFILDINYLTQITLWIGDYTTLLHRVLILVFAQLFTSDYENVVDEKLVLGTSLHTTNFCRFINFKVLARLELFQSIVYTISSSDFFSKSNDSPIDKDELNLLLSLAMPNITKLCAELNTLQTINDSDDGNKSNNNSETYREETTHIADIIIFEFSEVFITRFSSFSSLPKFMQNLLTICNSALAYVESLSQTDAFDKILKLTKKLSSMNELPAPLLQQAQAAVSLYILVSIVLSCTFQQINFSYKISKSHDNQPSTPANLINEACNLISRRLTYLGRTVFIEMIDFVPTSFKRSINFDEDAQKPISYIQRSCQLFIEWYQNNLRLNCKNAVIKQMQPYKTNKSAVLTNKANERWIEILLKIYYDLNSNTCINYDKVLDHNDRLVIERIKFYDNKADLNRTQSIFKDDRVSNNKKLDYLNNEESLV